MWAQEKEVQDKTLSIVLASPSTLFLNHLGPNVAFYPTGPLPFQYVQRELALNKHSPASNSLALKEGSIHLSQ